MTVAQSMAKKITEEYLDGMRTDSLMDFILNITPCSYCEYRTDEFVIKKLKDGQEYESHCDLQNHPEKYDKYTGCTDGMRLKMNKEAEE